MSALARITSLNSVFYITHLKDISAYHYIRSGRHSDIAYILVDESVDLSIIWILVYANCFYIVCYAVADVFLFREDVADFLQPTSTIVQSLFLSARTVHACPYTFSDFIQILSHLHPIWKQTVYIVIKAPKYSAYFIPSRTAV